MAVYDDEIDLRPYIQALIRHWWQIALLAVIAAGAALAISLVQTKNYEATTTLLLTRSRANLSLAEQFPTVNDQPLDASSRMDAILTIAQSDSIAQATIQSLGSKLPIDKWGIDKFKKNTRTGKNGDAILITAIADNPDLAAEIANTWAGDVTQTINQAYRGEQPLADIQSQRVAAQKQYETTQAALEAFIKDNHIDLLNKRIAESQTLFSNLSDDRSWQISYYENRKRDMQALMTQAEALKKQLENGNNSTAGDTGDALAVLIARANALGVIGKSPGSTFDLQLSDLNSLRDTTANYKADLDALLRQATEEKVNAEATLNSLAEAVIQGQGNDLVNEAATNIRNLTQQLESEQARQRELTNDRDLAWKAYQTLLQKETEIKSAPQTSNEVIMAGLAIPPERPVSRGTLRNTLVGGVLGVLLGVIWILGVEWWRLAGITQREVEPHS